MKTETKCIDQIEGERFKAFNGDSIDIVAEIPENSIGL